MVAGGYDVCSLLHSHLPWYSTPRDCIVTFMFGQRTFAFQAEIILLNNLFATFRAYDVNNDILNRTQLREHVHWRHVMLLKARDIQH